MAKGKKGRQRKTLRGLGLSPTFKTFVEPVKRDRKERPTYAILDIEPAEKYREAAFMFTVPLRLGSMTGTKAQNLTDSDIREIAKLHGLKVLKVRGVARLKPDKERKGKRFKRAAKRNRRNR